MSAKEINRMKDIRNHVLTFAVLALNTTALFAGAFDNAWLKGATDKNPLSYKGGEEIVFTISAMDVAGEINEGDYKLQ